MDLKAEASRLAKEACMRTGARNQDADVEVPIIEEALLAFGRLVREEDIKFLEEHDWRKLRKDKALE